MTLTAIRTLKQVADESNASEQHDALQAMKIGTLVHGLKRTFTGLTGAATYNLTALDATGETVGASNPNRLGALAVKSLRVTAATTANSVGSYAITDVAGTVLSPTASTVVGLARISDDGTTLTFATADVTAFIIEYTPQTVSAAVLDARFAPIV